jgi:transcription antitermination factor NusG
MHTIAIVEDSKRHGDIVAVVIDCTIAQGKVVRDILHGFDASLTESMKAQSRFNVGQQVLIRRDDPSPFAGLPAVIDDVQPNDRGVTVLDRYVVVFAWGEKAQFYEPQLQPLEGNPTGNK